MRVSDLMLGSMLTSNLQSDQAAILQVEQQIATGDQINEPSDNPVGAEQLLQLQSSLAATNQYTANTQNALSWLSSAQSALGQAVQVGDQVQSLAEQGASATTNSDGLQSLQAQVQQLLSSLVDIGNTQYGSQYLFNGEQTNTAPYALSGGSVTTNYGSTASQALLSEIGPSISVTLNPGTDTPASNVFQWTSGGTTGGLIPAVQQILTDLGSGGDAAQLGGSDLTALQTALNAVEQAQSDTGAVMQQVQLAQTQLSSQSTNIQDATSSLDATDVAQAAVQLQDLQNAYEGALAIGSQMILPTLANYLH